MASSKNKQNKKPLVTGIAILTMLAVTLFAAFYFLFLGAVPENQEQRQDVPARINITTKKKATPVISPSHKKITINTAPKAKLTIIIDDIGHQKKLAEQIIDLDLQLTFSILPSAPFARHLAQRASARKRDVLLHLPMEPSDKKWNPGPGAMLLNMSQKEIADTLRQDLKSLPTAIGINNHMGSKFSENRPAVQLVLKEIKDRNLFFVDSLTSSKSTIYKIAKEMGIKTARRDVFIDNEKDVTKIKIQLASLIKLAQKRGHAIGIGHPYKATLAALAGYQQTITKEVELVGIHQLVQ